MKPGVRAQQMSSVSQDFDEWGLGELQYINPFNQGFGFDDYIDYLASEGGSSRMRMNPLSKSCTKVLGKIVPYHSVNPETVLGQNRSATKPVAMVNYEQEADRLDAKMEIFLLHHRNLENYAVVALQQERLSRLRSMVPSKA